MKEEIVKKANEMRLRPVDVHRASNGLVSQAQASNWLKGKVSAGAAFSLMLLCEKIEGGYVVPAPERKERSDKRKPRQVGQSIGVKDVDNQSEVKSVEKADPVSSVQVKKQSMLRRTPAATPDSK